MRPQPKTKEQVIREKIEADKILKRIKVFRNSHHYRTIMRIFQKEFDKDMLDGTYSKLSTLEQIGMVAAIQSESRTRFNNIKNMIEGM